MKIEWDAKLPNEIHEKWRQFYEELEQLETIRIPRKARPEISDVTEIHGFCDASEEVNIIKLDNYQEFASPSPLFAIQNSHPYEFSKFLPQPLLVVRKFQNECQNTRYN